MNPLGGLELLIPAAEEIARGQASLKISRIKRQMVDEQLRAFVVADQGGFIRRILEDPHTELVKDVRTVQVIRVEALEGIGTSAGPITEESPFRRVVYWHTLDGQLIARRDSWEEGATSRTNFVEPGP